MSMLSTSQAPAKKITSRSKKIAIAVGIVAGVLLLAVCGFCYIVQKTFGMTNQVYQETVSPDGKYVATLAYRDGLTFGYEYLSLQPRQGWRPLQEDDSIPDDEVGEMSDEGIDSIAWQDAHTLVVKVAPGIPKDCFVLHTKHWKDVGLVWRVTARS